MSQEFLNIIGGQATGAAGGGTLDVIAPSDGAVFASIPAGSAEDINRAVGAARAALGDGTWGRLTATDRGRLLCRLGEKILSAQEDLAQLEARDTGKPISQARADITACARYFEYYGGAADKVHGETIPFLDGYTVMVVREPHGVTGHIIPWNYPAQMFGRTLAPALAMGNATVLKPAEEACLTPLVLAEMAGAIGFPDGAINVVAGLGEEAGAALSAHPGIDFLTFTGSPEVGTRVQAAAAANHVGTVLELGGKSPHVVFDDANLDAAIPVICRGIVQNAGQTCSAGSRVLVQQSIFEEVSRRLVEQFGKLRVGSPEMDLDCGPAISAKQRDRIAGYLERARGDGIPVLAEGTIAEGTASGGCFVVPTLLGPVPADHELAREEVFGPVLALMPFADEADAVRMANDSDYGLMAAVWTENGGRQIRVARSIRCGQVYVNGFGAGGAIELPFGGVGKSGHGREKGFVALHEFSTLKTIILNHG